MKAGESREAPARLAEFAALTAEPANLAPALARAAATFERLPVPILSGAGPRPRGRNARRDGMKPWPAGRRIPYTSDS